MEHISFALIIASLVAAYLGYQYLKSRTMQHRLDILHQERLAALEKEIPLPELPLDPPPVPKGPDQDVLSIMGVVFSSLAAGGMITLYLILPAEYHFIWVTP
ncbi:MAG: hypothetical protein P8Y80_16750, partial [Acidobacteriota bacterium]